MIVLSPSFGQAKLSSSSFSGGGLRRSEAPARVRAAEGSMVSCAAQEGPIIQADGGFEVSVDISDD